MKTFLKKLFVIIFEVAIIAAVVWFVALKKGISLENIFSNKETEVEKQEASFPALANPVAKKYLWKYKEQNYSISTTLYQSAYDYYHALPKDYSYIGTLKQGWENDYYGMFLKQNSADQTIAELASQLQSVGAQHHLTDDQIVEMTMAFVQTISYDDSKAEKILAGNGSQTMQYPYETLFLQKGVCSDKSLLAYSILKQMGYGVELLAFEQDNHMAIGIQCPKNYANYNDGYCYAETTSPGNKIGVIPTFDSESNKTVDSAQLVNLDPTGSQQINLKPLGQAVVYQKNQGKQYSDIIATKRIENEIAQLSASITTLSGKLKNQKSVMQSEESQLNDLRSKLEKLQKSGKIDQYNSGVGKYNDLLEKYKKDVDAFNKNVSLYNQAVRRYNELISQ